MSSSEGYPYPSAFQNPNPPSSDDPTDDSIDESSSQPRKRKKRVWWILTWVSIVLFVVGVVTFITILEQVKAGKWGQLPDSEILENPKSPLATGVFTADGELVGKYYREKRTNVSYHELSPHLVQALIATEDERFKQHSGIDFKALFRVAVKTIILRDNSGGGGSTISQQLAKNLFDLRQIHQHNNIGIKKMQEWIIAVRLERKYTKEEILTMYLNTVDFLHGAFGIYEASNTYFGKLPKDLNEVESAALVAMLRAPSTYNVCDNYQTNKNRRATVFKLMRKNGYIEKLAFDSLKEVDIETVCKEESHNTGEAQYFREQLRIQLHKWGKDNGYDVYRDGLKVYTSLNSKIQAYAEKAAMDHMQKLQANFDEHWKGHKRLPWVDDLSFRNRVRHSDRYHAMFRKAKRDGIKFTDEYLKKEFLKPVSMKIFSYKGDIDTVMTPLDSVTYYQNFLHVGFLALDQSTGRILAWVGGINQKHFKYDHVNIHSKRQVGSTFKPFVYLTGLEHSYYPCYQAANVPVVFTFSTGVDPETGEDIMETWSPRNSDGKYGGYQTLQQGLSGSVNCVTAYVMKQVGPDAVVQRAKDLGIVSHMEAVPSLCLGTAEISVWEMTAAFNTFNNGGVWVEPAMITRIEDRFGNVLFEHLPNQRTVIDEQTNYAMVKMLERVVWRGTAGRLPSSHYYNIRTALAGKTGTTQDASDGWFIGFQPGITAGCWVGGEVRQVAFRNMRYGQGARMAMPIFGDFINYINADTTLNYGEIQQWPKPEGELPFRMDCPDIEYDPDAIQDGIRKDDDDGIEF